ncbi:BatA domain-containing protein [Candidatus Ulvibacter alkanivorans]|uniref:BatA domain-containing protein n=1 Tax=Candidatus Ulvibacter alkanivorans TaxID=2267620 RepID=UPI000DF1D2D1|nr:BatA domain-containing protein [Candidatus Ulvibacter alkanivorans]
MQFKHPELLYALFLLLIPIFIHLFQLRRFQKVPFTNVAFLKKVTIQTRKSSQLKKWLTLLLRLLALACLIIAFAQPFTASNEALASDKETVVYLDNSFSMQAKGDSGPLFERAKQELFDEATSIDRIHWFTNDITRRNSSVQDFKNDVLKLGYSEERLALDEVLLKANQLFSKENQVPKRLIIVSDFQGQGAFPEVSEEISIDAVRLQPTSTTNSTIDTVMVTAKSPSATQLQVSISTSGESANSIPVSLYKNDDLIAKTAVDLSTAGPHSVTFDIEDTAGFKGRVALNEPNIPFDNSLYFSINEPKKIKVLSINEANANYLQRIFDQEEFEYTQQSFGDLAYNIIPEQNFIIVNEVQEIPASLAAALEAFVGAGGSLLLIPAQDGSISSYNALLNRLGIGGFSERITQEKKITNISFDHPLYRDVFEKRIVNFQYPKVNSYYPINAAATPILQFEDAKAFILNTATVHISTASFNTENSNFQNSPLIVPTLYNMAQQSLSLPKLYYTIGTQNNFAVAVKLAQDEIIKIQDSTSSFIPLQQTKANKVEVTTTNEPDKAGTYEITNKTEFIQYISYNYDRDESKLVYVNPEDWEGVSVYDNISSLFDTINQENTINSFWKWFAIFALLFLLLEMLVLKFYKQK